MGEWFSAHPPAQPFRLFGRTHVAALAATGLGVAATIATGRRLGPVGRRRARRLLTAALWGQEASYHLWRLRTGTWSRRQMLPLHLCSVLVWGAPVALLRPRRWSDDLVWYWGIAGAPQALLTPDLDEHGFPHYRFHQFFASHGLLLSVPLWMAFVEGRRPTAAGAARSLVMLVAHAGLAHAVNRRIGSNYLFVSGRLETPSVLDHLPPWPRYLPILAGMAVVVMAASYAPFALADAVRARRARRR